MSAPRIFTPEYYQRLRELEDRSWWNAGMRDVADQLLGLARLPQTGVLLDVGCGSGQTMGWWATRHPGWRGIGLDVAADALAAARSMLGDCVMRASALEIPCRSGTVDLVITLDVLQHVPLDGGDALVLAEIARVLKPGGHLLVRTNAQAFPRTPDDPRFAFHKYEPDELRAKLAHAGFEVVRLSRVNALLGLAEIPRELRARREDAGYHGLLSTVSSAPRWQSRLKRAWLGVEGRAIRSGMQWPFGRSLVAVARR